MSEVEIALIASDRESAEAVARAASEADPHSEPSVGEQRGLAGDAAQWVVFATVAARAVVPVLESILWQLGLGRPPTEIEVDGVRITNPRKQDVEQLLAQHRARAE